MSRSLVASVLAVAIVAACIKGVGDLTPFPCAADLTCPGGLACGGSGSVAECGHATLDAVCSTGADPTDCTAAGANAKCSASLAQAMANGNFAVGPGSPIVPPLGACEEPCPCGTGRTCVNGVCLIDCTASASACPPTTKCAMGPAAKFCVPVAIHCLSVAFNSGSARCTSQLCSSRASNTSPQKVSCPDNMHNCPFESTCNATSTSCFCNVGRATFDCSDQPCTNGCAGGTYWCAPDVTTFDCNSDLDGMAATCKCWDGSQKAVTCADNVSGKSCEDLCAGR